LPEEGRFLAAGRGKWTAGFAALAWSMAPVLPALAQQVQADPVLDDPAFEASLPPLYETAPPASDTPPPLAAPPAPDAALSEPLAPLATFDAEPPPAPVATTRDQEIQIRYRIEVSGLDEVRLAGRFRDLSALYDGGRKASNAAQVSARAEEDARLAERLLRSEGYYDGVATTTIGMPANPGEEMLVSLTATPGARYTLGAIEVVSASAQARALALEALDLDSGAPIVAAEIETAEAAIALRLPEQGYPFAEVGARDLLLDERTHSGDYTLPVEAGPRSRFGAIRTDGDPVFDADHVTMLTRFDRGELYDSRLVDDLRQALIATSLLSTVSVEPVRTGEMLGDGEEAVDLLVGQTAGPRRNLGGSVGYGTGEGIKLTGSWTHRNLFPPEGSLNVTAVAGTQEQSLGTAFRRSNAGQRDRTFALGASVARRDFDAFNAQTIQLNGSLSRASTPIWQKKWTWSVGAEIIATRETQFEVARQDRARSTYFIAALPLQLSYDGSDSLLDPRRGFRVSGRLSPEAQKRSGGGFDSYGRLLLETSAYVPVSDSLVMAGRARVGSIIGAGRADIAPSRRYYAGGGGSVRGFGFQELGPKDIDDNPIGGRSLTEFAIEARYRFGNFGIVPFFDAGRVGTGSTPSLSSMRYGAGIGGRYYTNFGPMRIDVATPINRQPGESKIALYISIGQAF
jgi:translocation and assembly module TamA